MKPTGKHPDKVLTPVKLRNQMEPGRYTDGNGLYLVVDPSGAKRWLLRTVIKGKRCDIGLGGLSLVPLSEARAEAVRLRKLARAGGDPLLERRKERKPVPTFKQAAREVHAAHSPAWKNPKHRQQWINTLSHYAFPVFGDHAIDRIEPADVLKALSRIWLEKSETARRVKQRIRVVFDWAKASGFRSGDNPVEGISKVLPKQQGTQEHHAALPYSEVPAFIRMLLQSDAGEFAKLAFELLILTATRTNEVIGATWNEIDFVDKTWTIPAARMKTKQVHRVPLSPPCIEILERAKALTHGGTLIFPGRTTGKPLSNAVFLMTLRRMKKDITPHGFRSSFRDWAAERTSFPREVCEAALAHRLKDKTEAAYHRTDLFEKRRSLMATWAAFAKAMPAKVVPLRAGPLG